MLKGLLRTGVFFGSLFAAGYVAQRYFGWDAKGLLNQAKDKIDDATSQTASTLKSSIHEASDRRAI